MYRLYKQAGLNLRSKRPKRSRAAAHRVQQPAASRPNECWAFAFMRDALFDGRRFRVFTAIDTFTRECLEIHAGQSIRGDDVATILERLVTRHGLPERVQVDNGSEFVSKALDRWAYDHGVTLIFSRPGKPTDNAFIESFNGSFRDECLNINWFLSLEDAREKIGLCRWDYNIYARTRPWEMCRPGPTPKDLRRAKKLRTLTPRLDQERGEAQGLLRPTP